jgi:hypothetical protein
MKGDRMTKNDTIALIIEHMVQMGYKDSTEFVEYITMILPQMSVKDLSSILESLEELV